MSPERVEGKLTLRVAQQCLARAQSKAEEIGVPVSIAVVDEGGHLLVLARMDGAGFLTPEIARGKAFTAIAFRRSTREVAERFKDRTNFAIGLASVAPGKIVIGPGGLLVRDAQGRVVGAIGVSGATPEQDEECALRGAQL